MTWQRANFLAPLFVLQSNFRVFFFLFTFLFLFIKQFFSIFQYFPTTLITWGVYCLTVLVIITLLKLINYGFHNMYDRAQTLSDTNLKKSSKVLRETSGWVRVDLSNSIIFIFFNSVVFCFSDDEAGIEMQVLSTGGDLHSRISMEHSGDISCANSAISIDYQEPPASTIGEHLYYLCTLLKSLPWIIL